MKCVREKEKLMLQGPSAVTLGKFNGLHRGHQKLINRILEIGKQGYETVVCAFETPARKLLTGAERYEILEKMGVGVLAELQMDTRLMHMSPGDFVEQILVKRMHAGWVVVGPDFRFGYQRKGDTAYLKEMGKSYGFQVEILEKEKDGNRPISSTYIREQLNEGHIEKVNNLLGYPFSTTGEIIHGRGLGHTIGIPTTNLIPPKGKLMPPNGVYATRSKFFHREYLGITNVGYKPTVGGEDFLGVETYLFDCHENLYGVESTVAFYHFLRYERKFDSLNQLKEQLLRTDVSQAEEFFAEHSFMKTYSKG